MNNIDSQLLWIKRRFELINWEDVKDRTVLDIGCGDGMITIEAKKRGAKKAVGVDTSDIIKEASKSAKEQNQEVEFWQIDVESKEFYSNAGFFDVIFFMGMLTHIKDGAKMLEWISDHCRYSFYFGTNFFHDKEIQIKAVKHWTAFNAYIYLGESGNILNSYHLYRCSTIEPKYEDFFLSSIPTTFIDIDKIFEPVNKTIPIDPDLEQSIKNIGIKNPIIVRRVPESFFETHSEYPRREFIGMEGGNRFLIIKKIGYKSIPCKIIKG